jgi:signal transduction histidine kinase
MVVLVQSEDASSQGRFADLYQQVLKNASASLKTHLKPRDPARAVTPAELFDYYRAEFDPAVKIRIVGADGLTLAGDAPDSLPQITEASVGESVPGVRVRLFSVNRSAAALMNEEINTCGWTVAAVALANIFISGAAAMTLHRQSRLGELKSSALATVAHELKTPLASMRVLTDTLLDMDVLDPDRCRTYIHLIAAENDRLIRLTENFLTLSRFETAQSHRETVQPVLLAEAALKSLESRFKEAGIQPATTFENNLPTITVNRESTVVVLVNLLDNALKYSAPGSPISFRVGATDGKVQFIVEDHGVGISAEAQPRIFDRFFQADQKLARSREGCGLGLYIAHSIVEAHGGTISVRSAPGSGSTFYVTLPASKPA